MEQLPPGGSTFAAQAETGLAKGNSPAMGPEGSTTPLTVSGWFPPFVSVMTCAELEVVPSGWLPKFTLSGETTASGPPPIPTTSKPCEPFGASSAKFTNAPSGPTSDGTNPTSNEHISPGGIGAVVQAVGPSSEKSATLGPARVMLEIFRGASPEFFTATPCGGMVREPTGCAPKFTFPVLSDTLGRAALLGVISTRNASFSGGVCWQLAQVSCAPLLGFPATGKFPAIVAPAI